MLGVLAASLLGPAEGRAYMPDMHTSCYDYCGTNADVNNTSFGAVLRSEGNILDPFTTGAHHDFFDPVGFFLVIIVSILRLRTFSQNIWYMYIHGDESNIRDNN